MLNRLYSTAGPKALTSSSTSMTVRNANSTFSPSCSVGLAVRSRGKRSGFRLLMRSMSGVLSLSTWMCPVLALHWPLAMMAHLSGINSTVSCPTQARPSAMSSGVSLGTWAGTKLNVVFTALKSSMMTSKIIMAVIPATWTLGRSCAVSVASIRSRTLFLVVWRHSRTFWLISLTFSITSGLVFLCHCLKISWYSPKTPSSRVAPIRLTWQREILSFRSS
ncbi:hypothetical protein HBI56_110410 [Parastagonospora nodorum]|nr:hypothetical protein HBH53_174860 [Parastagonospora nodorum]KAH4102267.1 hypothetical protein HBH46_129450 [Parastagonospora nodorum]KAH4230744.1 hypothetical protein HBI06_085400 [Parastagonospora nodorum]KAH4245455.1 hypothetical protein HBI05_068530 [Parastagonospora nodorum]KAH4302891.1 hypothetical protein HBI01_090290 [Parastagonospora nodorum]